MQEASVIVLELNELTPHLMKRWIDEGKLPAFKKLFEQSTSYVTDAEEPVETLEPWIQWVTVHSGLKYKEHGIYDLGSGHKLRAPRLWDVVSDVGKRVWICGSMNSGVRAERKLNGAILPDPWSVGLKPYPETQLKDFYHFVRTSVQEYTNKKVPLTVGDYWRFALFLARNGLSSQTIALTMKQLASERSGKYRWARAMVLDRMAWDVFRFQWRKIKPHYATVFLNSCAHLQHHYWRNMSPEDFEIKPPAEDQAEYRNAILRGYQAMDKIVQEALDLVQGTNTSLVMMTALSQKPLVHFDRDGGKQLYKSIDPQALLGFAGVQDPATYAPIMAEDFRYIFSTAQAAANAQKRLDALRCVSKPLLLTRLEGSALLVKCAINQDPGPGAMIASPHSEQIAFIDAFYPMLGIKSGCHHPDGLFWVRQPGVRGRIVTHKLPLSRTTATLAQLAGLDASTISKYFVHPAANVEAAEQAEPDELTEAG